MGQVFGKILLLCSYSYLVAVIIVLTILWISGDRWWFGTVLMYGPRWVYALPLFVLAPLAIIWQRNSLWPLAVVAIVITCLIMGINIPTSAWSVTAEPELRILTYNVHRWGVGGEKFSRVLEELQPDIAAVQECAAPRRFKREISDEWFTHSAGYSVLVSRYPITQCETHKRDREINGLYCVIETPRGPVGFGNIDLLTPRRALDAVLDRETLFDLSKTDIAQERIAQRWQESEKLFVWTEAFSEENKILAGDFNLTVDSPIYRNIWKHYQNAYSQATFGYGATKKTKVNVFKYRSRIDHILSTSQLKPLKAWVGRDYGSDHLPLIAEFAHD